MILKKQMFQYQKLNCVHCLRRQRERKRREPELRWYIFLYNIMQFRAPLCCQWGKKLVFALRHLWGFGGGSCGAPLWAEQWRAHITSLISFPGRQAWLVKPAVAPGPVDANCALCDIEWGVYNCFEKSLNLFFLFLQWTISMCFFVNQSSFLHFKP